jgi:nucleoside-diphosphate-sugar epimerase
MTVPRLFCFGFGYTARVLARRLAAEDWIVGGTCRTEDKATELGAAGFPVEVFDRDHPLSRNALDGVTHLLVSVPPDAMDDPVLAVHGEDIAGIKSLLWLGYHSTTGVYGNRGGGWVDETAELSPSGERGRRRVAAEAGWLDLWRRHLRPRPQPLRGIARRHGETDRQAGPGILPYPCRGSGMCARRLDQPAAARGRL